MLDLRLDKLEILYTLLNVLVGTAQLKITMKIKKPRINRGFFPSRKSFHVKRLI